MSNDILKIPQYMNTVWFGSIIMTILYSKYSRELLLKTKALSTRKEPLAQLLYKLLKKDKDLKIDLNNFKLLKPTRELFKSLNLDLSLYDYIYSHWWNSWLFIIHFFRYINTSYLVLDYYKNNLYFGVRENLNIYIENETKIAYDIYEQYNDNYIHKAVNNCIKKNTNPNYISVNVWGKETYNDPYIKYLNMILSTNNNDKKLNFDSYKSKKYKGLKELNDEIIYNNYRYKLDSVILDDYINIGDNSDITNDNRYGMIGITSDKDVKYVYNAQARTIDDNEYNLIYKDAKNILPCEYIEYKWEQNNSRKKLILKRSVCSGEKKTISTDDNYLVYNFGKGIRTLIYVKQERVYTSKSTSSEIKKREKKQRNDIKIKINSYKEKIQEYKEKINIEKKALEKIKKRY